MNRARARLLPPTDKGPLCRLRSATLLEMECVATGEGLTRYAGAPFHFGMATCGPEAKTFDLLAAKIELLGAAGTAAPTPVARMTAKAIPTAKPAATKKPGTATKPLSNPTPVAPGTRFKVLEFGENDPLATDPTLVGMECVADGFLLRYQHVPFHYGQAKCGDDERSYDPLAAKIEVLEIPKPALAPVGE